MSHRQSAAPEIVLDWLRQPEQSQRIGDGRAVLPQTTSQLLLGPAKLSQEPLVCLRSLYRVQVLAEKIFDQAELKGFRIARLANDRRNPRQTRLLGCSPTSLSHEDLVLATSGPHNEWLKHPGGSDRGGKLLKRLRVEAPSGLLRVGDETLEWELAEPDSVLGVSRRQESA
jgi:hypothetical protein